MNTLKFNDALRVAGEVANASALPAQPRVGVVRDIYGRLRFAVDAHRPSALADAEDDGNVAIADNQRYPLEAHQILVEGAARLGAYASTSTVLYREDFYNPATLFENADWHETTLPSFEDSEGLVRPELTLRLLDRQITGQDWLRPPIDSAPHPHRVVFFGLKGGVGRSTALSMVAWGLARQGKTVLLIDFDLESPGLSSLVLPPERVAEFGIVDWLVEDAVGQGDSVLGSMVSASPLAETTTGAIRVAAAMGQQEQDYLAKLARAYADVPGPAGPVRMGARLRRILELLEAKEQPDVVLIDSRAGLHDLAAVAITSLADTALLFATDSAQTWLGFRQLFSHWQRRRGVVAQVRDRLAVVRALTPKTDRETGVRRFQSRAYKLFAETLYDEIPPASETDGMTEADGLDLFHPSEADEAAPHYPILVDWDERFLEFDPALRPEQGGATEAQVDATFGALIRWISQRTAELGP